MRHSLTYLPDLHILFQFLISFEKALVGIMEVTTQAAQIKDLKSQIKQLKNKAKPVITHHKAWMKIVSMKQRLAGKKSLKKKWMQKESIFKQGRKSAKSTPTTHTDQVFDDVDVNDAMDYMETDAYMQKGVSTEDQVSTFKPDEGTDKPKVSTDKPEVSTAKPKEVEVSTDKLDEGTAEPKDGTSDESTAPTTVFRDDETIAEFLASSLIDPKDKGKKVLEEEAESEGVDEAERKFDQLAKDEEITRKARIEADRLLAARLQEEEREMFTVEDRAKFLYDTIAAQRRFLAQQRAATIRRGKKHADLKKKNFEEIQVLYKKVKRDKEEVLSLKLQGRWNSKVTVEQEVTKQGTKKRKSGHVKMIARKRPRPQPDDDSDDEHRKCLRIVTFNSTIDSEIMETKSFVSKLHKVSSPDGDYLIVCRANGHFRAFNYLMEVLHIFDRQDLFHLYDLVMKQYLEITPEEIAALVDAVKAMLHHKSSHPASVKAVEEICVTCGGLHPYHQCLATDGNVFPEYRDNIQGYVSVAAINYNQGNTGYPPQSVANQILPPGFAQPNVQNNQSRYNQGYNQNRGNNQGNLNYQTPIQQTQVAPSNELSNYKKINDANMKAMQNQINNVKNELRNEMQTSISNQTNELKNMMANFFQMNTASSSGSGSLC
ncbi:hypothetical protein Tco_0657600 [Tanacetum coccineum]